MLWKGNVRMLSNCLKGKDQKFIVQTTFQARDQMIVIYLEWFKLANYILLSLLVGEGITPVFIKNLRAIRHS